MTFVVAANTGTSERTGTLTVAGQTVTVTQAGAPAACIFSLSPSSQSIPATGGSGTVTVGASPATCAWTAAWTPGNASTWVTTTAGATGTGGGSVQFTAAANTGSTPRSATLTVGGQTFTLNQAGASAACTYSLSPSSQSVPATGGAGTVTVGASPGTCAWTAAWTPGSASTWITTTAGASGTGNGAVQFTVAANSGVSTRNATLTVGGQTFTVNQAGTPAACAFSLSPSSQSVVALGASGQFTVTPTPGSCAWTVTDAPAWVLITSGATGTGNGTVRFTVAPNLNPTERVARLKVGREEFTITQAAPCSFTIVPTSQPVGAGASNGQIGVTTLPICSWTATTGTSWLSITAPAGGTGNGTARYAVAANPTTSQRIGTLTVAGHTVTITQAAQPTSLSGKLSGKTGNCPNLTFALEGRTVKTNTSTSFAPPCGQLNDKDKVDVTGFLQPDGSVLASSVRPG